MKTKVIGVVGPTAVGKTELGINIAKHFNGEIISGDAMQVYKGMDIGTAKIPYDKIKGITHHMIDIKTPDEPFTAAEFQKQAQVYIEHISSKGKVPILVGGSGLYVQSVLYNYQFSNPPRDNTITDRLTNRIESEGIQPIYDELKRVDPTQAQNIHPNNVRRVIRALEVYQSTGITMTDYQNTQSVKSPYDPYLIGLEMNRDCLYKRINERVDRMVAEGLVQEVDHLYTNGYEHTQAMKAIGYKEILPYLKNETSLNAALELLKRNSRRFAKRQYTWFKNKMNVHWYSLSDYDQSTIEQMIFSNLAGFLQDM